MRTSLFVPALALLLPLLLLGGGCATRSEVGLPVVHGRFVDTRAPERFAAEDEPELASHWQEVPADFARPLAVRPPTPVSAARPGPPRAVRREAPPETILVPVRKSRREARPEGKKPTKSDAQLARDHYLDYPTHIRAQKITLALPAPLAARARLTGEQVDRSRAGRTLAHGAARLSLDELTLEAERITLRVQPEGRTDLQVMARGDVHLISEVRGNVTREQGLRSLLITNDRIIPLR